MKADFVAPVCFLRKAPPLPQTTFSKRWDLLEFESGFGHKTFNFEFSL